MAKQKLVEHRLKRGRVVLEREKSANAAILHFSVDMDALHPAETIFDQLILGLTNSEESWIWPVEYEQSAAAPPERVAKDTVVRMTYRVPRFDKPEIPAKEATYSYRFAQFNPGEFMFEYQSIDHPLEGGAVVRVVPLDTQSCRVLWRGSYVQDQSQEVVVQSMVRYFPFLYDTIESLIEAGPPEPHL